MIKLSKLAERFENGLNAALNNPEIEFKIWSTAGEWKKAERDGNKVTYFINGDLRVSSSSNDANILEMGINGLTLTMSVPVQAPRTNSKQTEEQLQKVKDGKYPFLDLIVGVVNDYFAVAQAFSETDENGDTYSIGYHAGTSISGTVDLVSILDQNVIVEVYIECYFIKNGVNSKDVVLTIDNDIVPYQTVKYSRNSEMDRDVYAATLVSKSITSSTAFSVDLQIPANDEYAARECVDYIFDGAPNQVHFVNVAYGDIKSKRYLMAPVNAVSSAGGIEISGLTVSFTEVTENADFYDLPKGFQKGRFEFATSTGISLSIMPSVACQAYIDGNVYVLSANKEITVRLNTASYGYDEDKNIYFVTIITDRAVSFISVTGATFKVENG